MQEAIGIVCALIYNHVDVSYVLFVAMNFKSLSNAFSSSSSSGDKRSSEDNDCSEKFVDALEALLHPDAAEDSDGGLCCNDKKLVADTRKCVSYIVMYILRGPRARLLSAVGCFQRPGTTPCDSALTP